MQAILAQCNAATFGRGNKAVLDPSYRSAYHLPPSRFVTSFQPAQPGSTVLADIARMLDPADSSLLHPPTIQAELYNLNIYTTGGLFKAHVDTPRAENMFGSLVVCLPVPHEGGQLTVRHGGQSRVFDWSWSGEKEAGGGEADTNEGGSVRDAGDSKVSRLQWAAFFGNCEHEVAPVTSGYRCTLTYNLYQLNNDTSPPSTPVEQSQPAQPLDRQSSQSLPRLAGSSAIPLIRALREALADRQWMAEGGVVGIKCAHAYAHTSSANEGSRVQPGMLKGIDALLYSSLAEQLRLKVEVKLVAENERYEQEREELEDADDGCEEGGARWYVSDTMEAATSSYYTLDYEGGTRFDMRAVLRDFTPLTQPVTWLDDSEGSREFAASYLTYGNEPGSGCVYTEVALFVHVPPYTVERGSEAVAAVVLEREAASKAQPTGGRKRGRGVE